MTTLAPVRPGHRRQPRPPHPLLRWFTAAGVLATMAFALGLWVAGRGVGSLTGPRAVALTSAGRVTGMAAADLLLLQVVLIARIPWVERWWGQDRLARWHRWVGFGSFHLMVAHVVLVTLGYAGTAHRGAVAELVQLVTDYPGMLLATVGTLLLVGVTVTSVRMARRRLRYESWHLLHLYAYLGIGFSIPHELWTGTEFTTAPRARLLWWLMYGVVLAAILVFRLAVPMWLTIRHRLRVASVVVEADGVVSVYLTGHRLDRLPVRAGQFFVWRFLDGPGWTRGNPYSLSAAPDGRYLRITARDFGDGSGRLARLRPGTRALIEGPYGGLTGARRRRHRILMLAAGIGITPLRALLGELDYNRGEAVLLYRARSQEDVVFREELQQLAEHRGVRVEYVTGPRQQGRWLASEGGERTDAQTLRRLVPDLREHDVFLCGPEQWMTAARRTLLACAVPDSQIHLERFVW